MERIDSAHRGKLKKRVQLVVYRYVDLVIVSVIGIGICFWMRPWLAGLGINIDKTLSLLHWSISLCVALVAAVTFWWLLVHIAPGCLSGFFRMETGLNPPVWVFGTGGFIGLCCMEYYLLESRGGGKVGVTWEGMILAVVVFGIGALIVGLVSRIFPDKQAGGSGKRTGDNSGGFEEISKDFSRLVQWVHKEEPIADASEDLFGMAVFARRIVDVLQSTPLRTIGLVGPNGCGKSSVLKMVRDYLQDAGQLGSSARVVGARCAYPSERIISCRVSGWGLQEASAAEHVLQAVIKELSRHVDCVGLKSLPSRYSRAMVSSGSPFAKVLGSVLGTWENPLEILSKLEELLARVDKRLAILLEDIDRNKRAKVFYNEISNLLDALKGLENVSFVLAIGEEYKGEEVLIKTSEHIETLPKLSRRQVIGICETFRRHCVDMLGEEDRCASDEKRGEWMGVGRSDVLESFVDLDERLEKPIDCIAALLVTPRLAKAALRRTWGGWRKLRGEIDFDELLIANVLRVAAPEGFIFVNEQADKLRSLRGESGGSDEKKRIEAKRARLRKEFEKGTREVQWDLEATGKLINELFPGWEDSGDIVRWVLRDDVRQSCQRVAIDEPTDYWSRMMREELSSGELHDQEVIHAVRKWKNNNGAVVYKNFGLGEAVFEVEGFAAKVEQFRTLLDGTDVRRLGKELFSLILKQGNRIVKAEEYFGFIELWRLSLDKPIEKKEHERWVLGEIELGFPVSLQFANDLYYYWRHQDRSTRAAAATPALRSEVVKAAKLAYAGRPDVLIKALERDSIYSIYHFAVLFSETEQGGSGFKGEEWKWLGDVLLEAGEENPEVVGPQISLLLVNIAHPFEDGRWGLQFTVNLERINQMFGGNTQRVMEVLAKDIDTSRFQGQEKQTVDLARHKAKEWLAGVNKPPE